jgi:prevent-host-death family protein
METIGVRELRQHASRYLERVRHGETLEVTDRGRPVARLVPVSSDVWTDMVASGEVTLADDQTDLVDEVPGEYELEASATLAAMRQHER